MKDEFSQITPEGREPPEEQGVEVAFGLLQPETLEQPSETLCYGRGLTMVTRKSLLLERYAA
jgi:hypothetical protein